MKEKLIIQFRFAPENPDDLRYQLSNLRSIALQEGALFESVRSEKLSWLEVTVENLQTGEKTICRRPKGAPQ